VAELVGDRLQLVADQQTGREQCSDRTEYLSPGRATGRYSPGS
jgi:hypothetical protein